MGKKYAVIDTYGKVIVPVSMLEKLTQNCYIGTLEWTSSSNQLVEVRTIDKVELIDQKDIDDAKVQMELTKS